MFRPLCICLALVGLAAAVAGAADREQLAPGVVYEKQAQLTRRGPVVLHVVTAPRPVGNYALEPVLANGVLAGRERLTAIARRQAADVVALSGDVSLPDGRPYGMFLQNGVLVSAPVTNRSTLGIDAQGNLQVARVELKATWNGTGQRRPLTLNRPPASNGVSLFTPTWGGATPPASDTVEVVLSTLPAAAPNAEVTGTVASVRQGSGPIPAGGAVLVGRGARAGQLAAEAPVGATVAVRFSLNPAWAGVVDAIGGGPLLVRDRRAIFRAREAFGSSLLATRQARAAVGQRADGKLILVAVEGGRRGASAGLSNFELARMLVRLGAVTGYALAPGPQAAMVADGRLLTRPVAGGERPLADALVLIYRGASGARK